VKRPKVVLHLHKNEKQFLFGRNYTKGFTVTMMEKLISIGLNDLPKLKIVVEFTAIHCCLYKNKYVQNSSSLCWGNCGHPFLMHFVWNVDTNSVSGMTFHPPKRPLPSAI